MTSGTSHQAWPIVPRDGVPCRRCHLRAATYRAVRNHSHRHTRAAKYRCLDCINEEGFYEVMGPPKAPALPVEKPRRVRESPFDRARARELERLKTWTGSR